MYLVGKKVKRQSRRFCLGIKFQALSILLSLLFNTNAMANELACEYKTLSTMPIRFAGGSGLPTIEGKINQRVATMLLDTGSNLTYIMPSAAESLNLRVGGPSSVAHGIGGASSRSITRPDSFEIGVIRSSRPYLFVLNGMGFAPYFDAIAGADYLFALDLEVDLQASQIRFLKAKDCATYPKPSWAMSEVQLLEFDKEDDRPQFRLNINGTPIRAIIDTASALTILSLKAAEKLGISESSGRMESAQSIIGVGSDRAQLWKAKVDQIEIGNLRWNKAEIRVGRLSNSEEKEPEMLLGKDFLLEHRVLFSMGSRRLYIAPLNMEHKE